MQFNSAQVKMHSTASTSSTDNIQLRRASSPCENRPPSRDSRLEAPVDDPVDPTFDGCAGRLFHRPSAAERGSTSTSGYRANSSASSLANVIETDYLQRWNSQDSQNGMTGGVDDETSSSQHSDHRSKGLIFK